jgi:tetratricopeptide (TPR) repeat protein
VKAKEILKWDDAVKAFKRCYELKKDPAVKTALEDAQVEQLRDVAHQALESKQPPATVAPYFEGILKINPNDPEAMRYIAEYKQRSAYRTAKDDADAAFAAKEWAKAKPLLAKALQLVDPADAAGKADSEAKLVDCDWNIEVEAANACRDKGDTAGEIEHLQKANQIKPTPEVDKRLADQEQMAQYQKHIKLAKDFLARNMIKEALAEVDLAEKVTGPTAETRALRNDIQYQNYFNRGKALFDEFKYTEALGMFNIAKGYKDTPEVEAYIKRCKELIASTPKKPGEGG